MVNPAAAASAATIDSIVPDTLTGNDSLKNAILTREFGEFAGATQGTEQFTTLENDVIKVTFNNKGGRVYAVELKKYKTWDQKPLILFESDSTIFGINFFAQNRNISTDNFILKQFPEEKQNSPQTKTLRIGIY